MDSFLQITGAGNPLQCLRNLGRLCSSIIKASCCMINGTVSRRSSNNCCAARNQQCFVIFIQSTIDWFKCFSRHGNPPNRSDMLPRRRHHEHSLRDDPTPSEKHLGVNSGITLPSTALFPPKPPMQRRLRALRACRQSRDLLLAPRWRQSDARRNDMPGKARQRCSAAILHASHA